MSKNFNNIIVNYFISISLIIVFICVLFIPFISTTKSEAEAHSSNIKTQEPEIEKYISNNNMCWPLPGYTRISSPFGYRNSPTAGATSFHGGIDLPAPEGTNIISAISGKVTRTGFMGSGGCSVVVQNENYTVIFHHISPNYLVSVGDYVNQGQVIARVGPKNVYGFANNPYKDANRKPYKWGYNRLPFTFYG